MPAREYDLPNQLATGFFYYSSHDTLPTIVAIARWLLKHVAFFFLHCEALSTTRNLRLFTNHATAGGTVIAATNNTVSLFCIATVKLPAGFVESKATFAAP